jgi:hypothetical protein
MNAISRLARKAADFSTEHFALRDELERLQKVDEVGATEATVFYAARILEVLAADALRRVGLKPDDNVFANLVVLETFNLLPVATRSWSHALRRLGNQARHIQARIEPDDGVIARLFVERYLHWFFCVFRHGLRLPKLTGDDGPLLVDPSEALVGLLNAVEVWAFDPSAPAPRDWLDDEHVYHGTGVLPSLIAEISIERGDTATAGRALDGGLKRFPHNVRLCQLKGLALKRSGRLDDAREWLEPLHHRYRNDEETSGILGGVFKALWLRDRHRHQLERCHALYQHGWKRSDLKNAYLGINAAATSLWLARTDDSRDTAEVVRQFLESRRRDYLAHTGEHDFTFDFWDEVTLAEAELLSGNPSAARRRYNDAFARHSEKSGSIGVCREQLAQNLSVLDASLTIDRLLSQRDTPGQ